MKSVRRVLSFIMLFAILAGMIPAAAYGARSVPISAKTGMEELASQAGSSDPFAPEPGYRLKTGKSGPKTFDLRHVYENGTETSYITPVKVQNPYGACWGFAAIAAAESSLLSSGIAARNGYDVNTLDLSEKQLAWFATTPVGDEDNPQYGEGAVFREGSTPQDRYNAGGGTCFATNLFASGTGPTNEDTVTEDGAIFAYRGLGGEVNSENVTWTDDAGTEHSGVRMTSYSDEDDWTIPEKYRTYQDYRLKESFLLPNPVSMDGEYHPEATAAIKDQLLSRRAVSVSIMASHSVAGEDEDLTDNSVLSENWAQYRDWSSQNHVVTIVGYDDDYPVENFVKGNQPPGKGAWLVKNSWGSDLNDFPNNGYAHWGLLEGQDVPGSDYTATSDKHTGYFWLSYYDGSINGPEAYVFEPAGDDLTCSQHDRLPVVEYGEYATEAENRMSNVFTAAQNAELKEISVFTATPGTKVSFKVYILAENARDPEDGICVASSEEKEYPYGGYHRESVKSASSIYLCRGQKYSVVVTEKTPGGKYSISFGKSDVEPRHASDPRSFRSVINKGESFLYIDGRWRDMSDEDILNVLLADKYGEVWNVCADNFPIKAFTAPAPANAYIVVTDRNRYNIEDSLTLKKTEEMPLVAQFKGATGELPDYAPELKWESTDPGVFSVAPQADNRFKATVTGVSPGTAYLAVRAGIYGTRVIRVDTRKFEILNAEFPEDTGVFVYDGSEHRPVVTGVYAETETEYEYARDLEEGKDYTVEYSNNVLCGRATATVRGIGNFGGVVENNEFMANLTFLIVPAKAAIESASRADDAITVTFRPQKAEGISGYVLSYNRHGEESVSTLKLDADAESAQITGADPDSAYDISICAYVTTWDKDAVYVEEWDYYDAGWADHSGEASETVTVSPLPDPGAVLLKILTLFQRIFDMFSRAVSLSG